jgi:hypothetical protein
MNTPVLCQKVDIDLSEYPELNNPAIASAALVMACEYLAQFAGGEPGLWLDRFSNAAQLMNPQSLPLNPKLTGMIMTLIQSWTKLKQQAQTVSDDATVAFCQTQIDDLIAALQEWEVIEHA